jgi:hypothetical protein
MHQPPYIYFRSTCRLTVLYFLIDVLLPAEWRSLNCPHFCLFAELTCAFRWSFTVACSEVCCVRDVTQELHRIGNQLNTSPRAGNVQQRLSSFLQSSISRQDFVLKFQTVFHFKCQLPEKKVCINLQRFETLTDITCDLCFVGRSPMITSTVCASDIISIPDGGGNNKVRNIGNWLHLQAANSLRSLLSVYPFFVFT